jgi:hypothetical protein
MIVARIVFWIAGAFGVLALVPLYRTPGNAMYYGLLATLVAWQIAFFIIGWRPRQLRPLMIPAILEKALWMATLLVLLSRGQITRLEVLLNAATHGLLGVLFIIAFFTARPLRDTSQFSVDEQAARAAR